jgi:hypothetical protein
MDRRRLRRKGHGVPSSSAFVCPLMPFSSSRFSGKTGGKRRNRGCTARARTPSLKNIHFPGPIFPNYYLFGAPCPTPPHRWRGSPTPHACWQGAVGVGDPSIGVYGLGEGWPKWVSCKKSQGEWAKQPKLGHARARHSNSAPRPTPPHGAAPPHPDACWQGAVRVGNPPTGLIGDRALHLNIS